MSYRTVFRPGLFKDRTIIVTGGGSGIGRCVAHELGALGAHVVLIGRKEEKLRAVEAELIEDGVSCSWWSCDIRDEERVADVVHAIHKAHGPIYGLVNNAGGQYPSPLTSISKKGFDAVVATNLTGGFLMSREVFDQSMCHAGEGAIVNIVADMWRGMPGMGHSGAARAGMVNLTKTAAVEWAWAGVRVNAVAPGWIASSGMDTYPDYIKETIPKLKHHVVLKRLGTESEIAASICFLLSEAASFMTGVTLEVDGGAPLYPAAFPVPYHRASKPYDGFHRAVTPECLQVEDEEDR